MEMTAGRLTRDAQVHTVNGGAQVVNFSIAKNKSYKNKQGERVQLTEYVDCAYWRTAKVAQYLTKGTSVQLLGWMDSRIWTDKEGQPHSALNFRVDSIEFLAGGNNNQTPQQQQQDTIKWEIPQKTDEPKIEDDLPF